MVTPAGPRPTLAARSASMNAAPASALSRRPTIRQTVSNMDGPLYKQSVNNAVLVRRMKRKNQSPMKQLTGWFVENQIGLSFNLFALLALVHVCLPKARGYTTKFFTLSYHDMKTGLYGVGADDGYLLLFFVALYTGLRAISMDFIFAPLAKAQGISKRKTVARFAEQAWMLLYYAVYWSLGMYIFYKSDYFLSLRNMWTNWPVREISGLVKFYVLGQLAFWIQQVIVINIEAPRKDHWQMVIHHICTIGVITAAYRFHFTRVTNLVLILMDFADLVLPAAKLFKYLGHQTACDIMFGIFFVQWFPLRHIFFPMAIWSVYHHTMDGVVFPNGCYRGMPGSDSLEGPFQPPRNDTYAALSMRLEALWKRDGIVCYDDPVRYGYLAALLFLQGLSCFWCVMLVRVAAKVAKGGAADDSRSDEEDEEVGIYGNQAVEYEEELEPFEEEVGVEEIDFQGWERRTGHKREHGSASTGVSLPGHSDRKELLGRIGCDKQVD